MKRLVVAVALASLPLVGSAEFNKAVDDLQAFLAHNCPAP